MHSISMRNILFGIAGVAAFGLIHLLQSAEEPVSTSTDADASTRLSLDAPIPLRSINTSWGPSPFEIGQPVPPDKNALIAERKRSMNKGGYQTPDEYHEMSLKELGARADRNDVSALLQLGERYWTEREALDYDVDSNVSDDPRSLSIQYFMLAARGGAVTVVATVANRLLESGDVVEAAAWQLVNTQHDEASISSAAAAGKFLSMTPQQRVDAKRRAEYISQSIGLPYRSAE